MFPIAPPPLTSFLVKIGTKALRASALPLFASFLFPTAPKVKPGFSDEAEDVILHMTASVASMLLGTASGVR